MSIDFRDTSKLGGDAYRTKSETEHLLAVRERLAALLEWSGLPQAELGRRIGKNEDWVSRRVKEPVPGTKTTHIRADEIESIAAALRVRPCALVDDGELARVLKGNDLTGVMVTPQPVADPDELIDRLMRNLPLEERQRFLTYLQVRVEMARVGR